MRRSIADSQGDSLDTVKAGRRVVNDVRGRLQVLVNVTSAHLLRRMNNHDDLNRVYQCALGGKAFWEGQVRRLGMHSRRERMWQRFVGKCVAELAPQRDA